MSIQLIWFISISETKRACLFLSLYIKRREKQIKREVSGSWKGWIALGDTPVDYLGGFVHRKDDKTLRVYVPANKAKSGFARDYRVKISAHSSLDAAFAWCLDRLETMV